MEEFKKAYRNALQNAIESFLSKTARDISITSIEDHMRPAGPEENPLKRPTSSGPIRILHPSHAGTYRLKTLTEGTIYVDIEPGLLRDSLTYHGEGNVHEDQVLRLEANAGGTSILEFGTSVYYAEEHEPRFGFLEGAFDDVLPTMPRIFDQAAKEIFQYYTDAKDTVEVNIKI